MKREWGKYIYKNRTGGDCQLVTACNAYYYLTGKTVDDETYQEYVDLSGCRHGSAISIEKVLNKLGIEVVWEGDSIIDLRCDIYKIDIVEAICGRKKSIPLPIEFNVQAKFYGFHSTLIVDHVIKSNCYRITNFKYHTTSDGWIFEENLDQFESFYTHRNRITYKLFGLKGDKKYCNLKKQSKHKKEEWFRNCRKYYGDKLKDMS